MMKELSSMSEIKSPEKNTSPEKSRYNDSERPTENSFQPKNFETTDIRESYRDSERSESSNLQPRGGDVTTSDIDKPDVTSIQKVEISKVLNGEQILNDTLKKGNFGEMVTDVKLKDIGYDRISLDAVTSLKDITHKGIDGVYFNDNGQSQYLIVDSKYGFAQLSDTLDGKQMSDSWIDKRLDEAVGKEKADDIRIAQLFDPENVCKLVAHIKEDGQVNFDKLDSNGDITERNVNIND